VARVLIHREVVESGELDTVPREQLVQALRRLEREPDWGKPLVRELKGCRSVRIGGSENRLVYRAHEDTVEVLAIGRRRESEVHRDAERRL
jgi:mRNA-degrading endonuclease RelE of RelBE toxin-antitoxin system